MIFIWLQAYMALDCMQVIRDLLTPKTYVIVVEHDLAVLDYLSDFICCLYGKPGMALTELVCFSARLRCEARICTSTPQSTA